MDAYVFRAALICADCAETYKTTHPKPAHADESDEYTYDSDDWPKGPYGDGGGEADSPQHCDNCGAFLENPLTDDGVDYVAAALGDPGTPDVLETWGAFYEMERE